MLALMGFATLCSVAMAIGAILLERAALMRRLPVRPVWIGAMLAMLALVLMPFGRTPVSSQRKAPASVSSSSPLTIGRASPTAPLDTTRVASSATVDIDLSARIEPTRRGRSADTVLLALWAAGSLFGAAALLGSTWRIARMQRTWRPAIVAGVPVLVSHDVGPAIVGLVHHTVVVPAWVETLSPAEQQLVLTHEREHVRAGDPLMLWSATLLAMACPWNVALWFALRRVRHAIELDCDARVLRARPDARAYCTLLMDVGERTLAGVAPIAALAEPASLLERRVVAMTTRRHRGWRPVFTALAGVVALGAGCVAPRTSLAPHVRALDLVRELKAALAADSMALATSQQERRELLRQLQSATRAAAVLDRVSDSGVRRATPPHPQLNYDSMGAAVAVDSVALAPSRDERWELMTRLYQATRTAADLALVNDSVVKRSALLQAQLLGNLAGSWQREEALLVPRLDDALRQYYPELYSRTDTAAKMVLLTYDSQGHLKGHSIRDDPHWRTNQAPDYSSVQIQWFGMNPRPAIHTTLVSVVERGDGVLPHETNMAYGGDKPADSKNVPPELQFGRRVDSLARVDYPEAYSRRDGAVVILVLFKADGSVARKHAELVPFGAAFDSSTSAATGIRRMRPTNALLDLVHVNARTMASSGATMMPDAPRAIFVWGVAAH